jgi:hypothetical protein
MSPRSQMKFFNSLHKIYDEQDSRRNKCDYLEEPNSPEYTIVSAIDDSCVLFAVKENQPNQNQSIKSESSSLESTHRRMTPAQMRNIYDP